MAYISHVCILQLVVLHSFAVYFLRFLGMNLEELIEGWCGSMLYNRHKDDIILCHVLLAVKHGKCQSI